MGCECFSVELLKLKNRFWDVCVKLNSSGASISHQGELKPVKTGFDQTSNTVNVSLLMMYVAIEQIVNMIWFI